MKIPFLSKRTEEPARELQQTGPIRGEISLRDPLLYPKGTRWYPYNPDVFVQKKGGLYIYDKMRRDEQVKACQWIKRLSVLCSGWDVEPVGEENADVEVADFVTDCLKRMPGTLEEKVKQVLTGMDYGFSVTEKVWGYVEEGEFKGKIGLVNLKTRKPHSWDFESDEYGNLVPNGLWQNNGMYKYDPKKFVIYSHSREFDNWYGISDLQAAYRSWWSKDVIIRFWNIFLEKFGMGIPYLHPGEGKQTIPEPLYTNLWNAISNLQNSSAVGQQAGDAIIEILESKRRGAGEYDAAIKYYDRAIARALLMPSGLGFQDESSPGSYARSKTHFDLWLWIMLDLRKSVEETVMNEQIVPELVGYNYTVKEYPRFRFQPLEEPETNELGKLWLEAIKGKAVHPDAEDELHFRRLIKFPERDRDEIDKEIEDERKAAEERAKNLFPVTSVPGKEGPGAQEKKTPLEGPEGKQTLHQRQWHRELTKFEQRVDFAQVERSMDALEGETRKRLQALFNKQMDKLMATVEKAADAGKIDAKWVNSLTLQYGVELQSQIKEFIRTGYEIGRRDAAGEIAKAKEKAHGEYVLKIPPKKMIDMLEKSSFWIKNVMLDTLTKRVQALLLNMLETGEAPGETLMKIRAAYDPYVGDDQVVVDQKQIEPYRIETVIRTNTTKAYNKGRMAEFADPELDGFVRAVQVSAILDSRTTDICRAADGKIIMLDDPLADRLIPPLHHQCRSIVVPVTEVDGEFEPSKQAALHGVLEEMPPDFGGNLDK